MMPFQAMRFRQGISLPLLDAYTANLWGAFSVTKLLTAATAALTAVNTNTASSATIGFSGNSLDTAALSTLSGGTDTCVVSELLNQQGTSARKFTASSTARPRIVNAGVFDGSLIFDGTNDAMTGGAASGTPTGFTVFFRGNQRNTGTQILMEHSTDYNANASMVAYYDAGALSIGVHNAGAQVARSDFSGAYPNNNVQVWRGDRTALGGGGVTSLFISGVKQTRSGNGDSGSITGSFASQPWYLGARAASSLFASLDVHTLLIYEAALSDVDCATVSGILASL